MKFFSIPLSIIAACCATNWYWMGQEQRQFEALTKRLPPPEACPVAAKELPGAADVNASQDIEARDARIAALEAQLAEALSSLDRNTSASVPVDSEPVVRAEPPGSPPARDVLADCLEAASRVQTLLQDAALFAFEALAAQIWPWPVDSSSATPSLGSLLASARSEAAALLPAEAASLLTDTLQRASAAADSVPQVQAALAAGSDATAFIRAQASGLSAACHAHLEAAVAAFVRSHPEHKADLEGHSPVFILSGCVVLSALAVLDLYMTLKVLIWVVRIVLKFSLAPCRACCRRSPHTAPEGKQVVVEGGKAAGSTPLAPPRGSTGSAPASRPGAEAAAATATAARAGTAKAARPAKQENGSGGR